MDSHDIRERIKSNRVTLSHYGVSTGAEGTGGGGGGLRLNFMMAPLLPRKADRKDTLHHNKLLWVLRVENRELAERPGQSR
jgi:hypothetical protein